MFKELEKFLGQHDVLIFNKILPLLGLILLDLIPWMIFSSEIGGKIATALFLWWVFNPQIKWLYTKVRPLLFKK